MTTRTLEAYDPRSYRRYAVGLTAAVDVETPSLFGAVIAEIAWTIAREWVRRYGVPFPTHRIVWTVGSVDDEARAGRLDRAEVHE